MRLVLSLNTRARATGSRGLSIFYCGGALLSIVDETVVFVAVADVVMIERVVIVVVDISMRQRKAQDEPETERH